MYNITGRAWKSVKSVSVTPSVLLLIWEIANVTAASSWLPEPWSDIKGNKPPMLIALVPALKYIAFAKIKTSVELAKFRRQTMTAGLKFLSDSLPVQCVLCFTVGLHPLRGIYGAVWYTTCSIKTPKHGPKVFGMQMSRIFRNLNQTKPPKMNTHTTAHTQPITRSLRWFF